MIDLGSILLLIYLFTSIIVIGSIIYVLYGDQG